MKWDRSTPLLSLCLARCVSIDTGFSALRSFEWWWRLGSIAGSRSSAEIGETEWYRGGWGVGGTQRTPVPGRLLLQTISGGAGRGKESGRIISAGTI